MSESDQFHNEDLGPKPFVEPDRPMVVWKDKDIATAPSSGSGGGKKVAAGVAGLALVGALGIGGVVAMSAGSDGNDVEPLARSGETTPTDESAGSETSDGSIDEIAEPAPETPETVPPTTAVVGDTTVPVPAPADDTIPEQLADADAMEFTAGDLSARIAADNPTIWAIYTEEGKIRLQGRVPTRESADAKVASSVAVVGEGNVIDEYVIDPSAPELDGGPVYVEQAILYASGSAEVGEDFKPLLDLGIVLFAVDPDVTVTLVGHTDSDGSAEANLALSAARIDSAIQYFRDRDVDTSRLIADPRGETDPIADNSTEEGRRLNRRIEIIIDGFAN